jgi:hypothetical protein
MPNESSRHIVKEKPIVRWLDLLQPLEEIERLTIWAPKWAGIKNHARLRVKNCAKRYGYAWRRFLQGGASQPSLSDQILNESSLQVRGGSLRLGPVAEGGLAHHVVNAVISRNQSTTEPGSPYVEGDHWIHFLGPLMVAGR